MTSPLEQIIGSGTPRKVPSQRTLGDTLLLSYFTQNLSSQELEQLYPQPTIHIILCDYLLRFGMVYPLQGSGIKSLLESFANTMCNQQVISPKTKKIFGLGSIETEMVATHYLLQLDHAECRAMIPHAKDMNDLKALLVLDQCISFTGDKTLSYFIPFYESPEKAATELIPLVDEEKAIYSFYKTCKSFASLERTIHSLNGKQPSWNTLRKVKGYTKTFKTIPKKITLIKNTFLYEVFFQRVCSLDSQLAPYKK